MMEVATSPSLSSSKSLDTGILEEAEPFPEGSGSTSVLTEIPDWLLDSSLSSDWLKDTSVMLTSKDEMVEGSSDP